MLKDLMAQVGKKGSAKITVGRAIPLTIPVLILDARDTYGRDEYKVTPLGGAGEAWMAARRVEPAL